jgi:hypothetical protein
MIVEHDKPIRVVAFQGDLNTGDFTISDIFEIKGDRFNWYWYWGFFRDRNRGDSFLIQNPHARAISFLEWSRRHPG